MAFEIDQFGRRGTLGRGANLPAALLMAQVRAAGAKKDHDRLVITHAEIGDHNLTPPGDTSPQRLTVFDNHCALITESETKVDGNGSVRASVRSFWLGATGLGEQIIAHPLKLSTTGTPEVMFYYRIRYVQ